MYEPTKSPYIFNHAFNRSNALVAARQFSRPDPGSRGAPLGNSVEGQGLNMRRPTPTSQTGSFGSRATPTPSAAPAVKQLSGDDWSKKIGSIIDEYLYTKDLNVRRFYTIISTKTGSINPFPHRLGPR